MKVLTKEMLDKAVKLASPTILRILDEPEAIWGPSFVSTLATSADTDAVFVANFGQNSDHRDWETVWGTSAQCQNSAHDALMHLKQKVRELGVTTANLLPLSKTHNHIHPSATAVYRLGCMVSVCGVTDSYNEVIAEILLCLINHQTET